MPRLKTKESGRHKKQKFEEDGSPYFFGEDPASGLEEPAALGAPAAGLPAAAVLPAGPFPAGAAVAAGAEAPEGALVPAAASAVPAAATAFSFFIRIFKCLTFGSFKKEETSNFKLPFSLKILIRSSLERTERCRFMVSAVLKLEWIDMGLGSLLRQALLSQLFGHLSRRKVLHEERCFTKPSR